MAYSAEFPFLLLVLHVSGWNNDATSYAARVCRNVITHGGGADGRTICCSTGLPGYIKYLWRNSSIDLKRQTLKNSTCTNLLSAFHGNITMHGRLDQLQASDRKQDIRYPSEMFLSTRNGRLGRMALLELMSLLTEAESEGQLL